MNKKNESRHLNLKVEKGKSFTFSTDVENILFYLSINAHEKEPNNAEIYSSHAYILRIVHHD